MNTLFDAKYIAANLYKKSYCVIYGLGLLNTLAMSDFVSISAASLGFLIRIALSSAFAMFLASESTQATTKSCSKIFLFQE